eukprot:TRINITY_DN47504_c0_g1_i1.p1 TRINITY_DN47504_c0_g1~~TRINITY_DN47504_c0_g1_i1.p1  ORF type:complete len:1103 (+),score=343.59 TRINITY_DN47504_c0_g1_i1:36-3311(+)
MQERAGSMYPSLSASMRVGSANLGRPAAFDDSAEMMDEDSQDWRMVADCVAKHSKQESIGLELVAAVDATERVGKFGKKGEVKHRVLAIARRSAGSISVIVIKKEAGGKDRGKMSVRKEYPLRRGDIRAEGGDATGSLIRVCTKDEDGEGKRFMLGSRQVCDAFLEKVEQCFRKAPAAAMQSEKDLVRLLTVADFDRTGTSSVERAEQRHMQLLPAEDDEKLARFMSSWECAVDGPGPAHVCKDYVDARTSPDVSATKVRRLEPYTEVWVVEVTAHGARISAPVAGWVPLRAHDGRLLLLKGEGRKMVDGIQLREAVAEHSQGLASDMALKIEHGEKDWAVVGDSLAEIALGLTEMRIKLQRYEDRMTVLRESLKKVESERSLQDVKRRSNDKLWKELDSLLERLGEAEGHIRTLTRTSDFSPDKLDRVLAAADWCIRILASGVDRDYPIPAVSGRLEEVRAALRESTRLLHAYLASESGGDFQRMGAELFKDKNRLSKKRPAVVRWRSHSSDLNATGSLHARWGVLHPLVPMLTARELPKVLELRRAYTSAMQAPYQEEIRAFFGELRRELLTSSSSFLLGLSTLEASELVREMADRPGYGTSHLSVRSPSEFPRSRAGSVCSDGATTVAGEPDPPEHSILKELDIWPFRSRAAGPGLSPRARSGSSFGGSDFGADSFMPSEGGVSNPWGDASSGGCVSDAGTHVTAGRRGKRYMRVEAGLAKAVISTCEVVLKEQDFLMRFFCFDSGSSRDLDNMMGELFGILDDNFKSIIAYVHRKCDLSYVFPVVMLVNQLMETLGDKSPFLSGLLTSISKELERPVATWVHQQHTSIEKCKPSGSVKHCLFLPCFSRFRVLFHRLERLCAPLPSNQYTSLKKISYMVNQMLDRLRIVSDKDPKYKDFFELKNYSFICKFLEQQREETRSEAGLKIVEWVDLEDLMAERDRRRWDYIKGSLLKDSFVGLFDFIDSADAFRKTRSAEELQHQSAFTKKKVADLLAEYTKDRHVEKSIGALYLRQVKHFYGHTPDAVDDELMIGLFHRTWSEARSYIEKQWARLENILRQCYPDLSSRLGCLRDRLREHLEMAEQKGGR